MGVFTFIQYRHQKQMAMLDEIGYKDYDDLSLKPIQ